MKWVCYTKSKSLTCSVLFCFLFGRGNQRSQLAHRSRPTHHLCALGLILSCAQESDQQVAQYARVPVSEIRDTFMSKAMKSRFGDAQGLNALLHSCPRPMASSLWSCIMACHRCGPRSVRHLASKRSSVVIIPSLGIAKPQIFDLVRVANHGCGLSRTQEAPDMHTPRSVCWQARSMAWLGPWDQVFDLLLLPRTHRPWHAKEHQYFLHLSPTNLRLRSLVLCNSRWQVQPT